MKIKISGAPTTAPSRVVAKKNVMARQYYSIITVLSLFVIFNSCTDSATTESTPIYQLNVAAEPAEAGSVTPASGEYDNGETVEISATANENWIFEKWQGGHNGTANPATLTMNRDKQITALFVKIEYALNKEIHGKGSIYERILPSKTTTHEPGTLVEVIAVPDEGWRFSHWESDLDGSENPTTLTMDGEKTVTAVFERREYELTVHIEGEGAVTEEIIQAKASEYPFETIVQLTANPATGWEFDRWEGDLTGHENPSQIKITDSRDVTAIFVRQTFIIKTSVNGEGSISKELISGSETELGYKYESQVEITATPSAGWQFIQWQGDIDDTDNPIIVDIDSNKEITAVFERIEYQLSIETSGEGVVSIELISGEAADNGYYYGTEVELTAEPDKEWTFVNWTGDIDSDENPITITIEENKSVTAVFARDEYTLDLTIDGDGEISIELLSGEQTESGYKFGAELRVNVSPAEGWNFVFWDGDINGTDNPLKLTMDQNYTSTAVLDQSPFAGGNGTEEFPYQISTVEQLQAINNYTDRNFVQINDIDASETENWNNSSGFNPIGDDVIRFTGKFNGADFTIESLFIDRSNENNVGLFSFVNYSDLKNIHLVNANITGSGNTGGIIGNMWNSSLSNSTVNGIISGGSAGGLVGHTLGSTITESSSSGQINGWRAGGLIGSLGSTQLIESNSSSEIYGSEAGGLIGEGQHGNIINSSSSGDVHGTQNVGGIAGSNNTSINNSYATGNVTGDTNVGGLVGNQRIRAISNSYATGTVNGNEVVGGLVGSLSTDGTIRHSFSSGFVSGSIDVGGLVGLNGSSIEFGYWDTQSTDQTGGVGRGPSTGTNGLTTSEMTGSSAETSMPEFDWINIWITTANYPILRWQQ